MLSLLVNKSPYRNALLAYALSVFVDSFLFLTVLKVLEIRYAESHYYTLYYIFYYLPAALFAIPLGAWIEKYHLQKVMRNSLLVRIGLILLFMCLLPIDSVIILFAYIFLESTIALFFLPANDALIPQIVNEKERTEANSLSKITFIAMHILGYVASSVFLQFEVSFSHTLLMCAAFLCLSVMMITRTKPYIRNQDIGDMTVYELAKNGLHHIFEKKIVRNLFFIFAVAWLVASSIDLIIVQYLAEINAGVETFGVIAASTFSGMILGAFLANHLYSKFQKKWFFLVPLFLYPLVIQSLVIIDHWYFTLPFFFIGGTSLGLFEVYFVTYLQDDTEPAYYSRVFSVYTMIINFMPLPGILLFGKLLSDYGFMQTVVVVSFLLLATGLLSMKILPLFPTKQAS